MAIPLTKSERQNLQAAGTDMHELQTDERGRRRIFGRKVYLLTTDCGNLRIREDGTTLCEAYDTDVFPRACAEFVVGGYGCVSTQLSRVHHGEDTLEVSGQ